MNGVNKVFIIGNLGQDPEMRYTPNGAAVTSFSIAVNTGSGDYERTDWFNVEVWNKAAESCNNYLHKGSRVWVEGQMLNDKWEDDEGNKRSSWKLKAFSVQFLDPKGTEDGHTLGEEAEDDIPF